jgi:Family of unknown function (DUF5719)
MTDASDPQVRRQRPRPERGRTAAVVGILVAMAAVAAVDMSVHLPTRVEGPSAASAVEVPVADALSSSAFCVGAIAGESSLAHATIYLTNSTDRAVSGVMTAMVAPGTGGGASSIGDPQPGQRRNVDVPARGTTAINPDGGLASGDLATSFAFAGGGVAAEQVVSGPNGWSVAPCASRTSSSWYFSGGSTAPGNALTLDLFNPSATDAVLNLTFLTDKGVVLPQNYQGMVVPAGRLVSENIGDFVQNRAEIATVVSTQSGSLIADELQQWSTAPTGGISLRTGTPEAASVWRFAQTTNVTGVDVVLHIANPGTTPAVAKVSVGLPMASVVPVAVPVPAQSIVTFDASTTSGIPIRTPYAITVSATAGIVVARSVQAPGAADGPAWGLTTGVASPASGWLVPGPGAGTAPGTVGAGLQSLAVTDAGSQSAKVVVTDATTGARVATMLVAPGSVGVLGSAQVDGLRTFEVRSSQPVAVEEDDGPSGSPGIVSSSGLPFIDPTGKP